MLSKLAPAMDSGQMMYSTGISFAEYLFACRDEIDVEAYLWEKLRSPNPDADSQFHVREIDALRNALRLFDGQAEGEVDPNFREQVKAACELSAQSFTEEFLKSNEALRWYFSPDAQKKLEENGELVEMYFRGLDPKNPKFPEFSDFHEKFDMDVKSVSEALPVLKLLAPPPKDPGAHRKLPPWRAIHSDLVFVRARVCDGLTKSKAIEAAAMASKVLTGADQNKIDRLRKGYKAKMDLREKT